MKLFSKHSLANYHVMSELLLLDEGPHKLYLVNSHATIVLVY